MMTFTEQCPECGRPWGAHQAEQEKCFFCVAKGAFAIPPTEIEKNSVVLEAILNNLVYIAKHVGPIRIINTIGPVVLDEDGAQQLVEDLSEEGGPP